MFGRSIASGVALMSTKLAFLMFLASVAYADGFGSITASGEVINLQTIACQATTTGNTAVSLSVGCETSVGFKTASSSAELGIGPYGIGVETQLFGGGCCVDFSEETIQYSWDEDFTIEGAQGSGFVLPEISGPCGNGGFGGFNVSFNLWGAAFGDELRPIPGCNYLRLSDFAVNPPIPVTFGVPYSLQFSGMQFCQEGEGVGACGDIATYLSNLTITDAAGNPLVIESVNDGVILLAPEFGSFALLATIALLITYSRLRKGHSPLPLWDAGHGRANATLREPECCRMKATHLNIKRQR